MNYKSFNLGDWIGHISGAIEDETTLDGNEMRDLVEFLSTLDQEPCEDCISREAVTEIVLDCEWHRTSISEIYRRLQKLPSVTPKYSDEEIDRAQAVEQAYVDKMVELNVVDVLNKIRADVINIADGRRSIPVRSVLNIFDKHKTESEGKE